MRLTAINQNKRGSAALPLYLNFEFILCVLFGWFTMQPALLPVVGLVITLCAMVPPYRWAGLWDPFTRSGGGGAA